MNIDITLIHTIGKISVTFILLLSFFLLTVKSSIKNSNRLFAAFLILVAFDLCGLFLYEWLNQHPLLDALRRTTSLLQMPLIYFYVQSICYQGFKFTRSSFKHGIVFLLIWLLFLPRFLFLTISEQSLFLQDSQTIELLIKGFIGEVQYFFYIYLIFKTLANYRKLYQENYSNYDKTSYDWLYQMTIISLFAHVFALTKDFMIFYANPALVLAAHLVISMVVLAVICWLVLKALYHPSITRGVPLDQTSVSSLKLSIEDIHISMSKNQKAIDDLKKFMKTKEPYLDPDLTIDTLSQMYGVPNKELSILINYQFGQNFFNFINNFRINKAKQMLKDPENKSMSVLQILYAVGFNSKSSFNTAFKKYTGQTPSSYRKNPVI